VSEIGDNAIIRSTGVSTSQSISGSQEAKDFKVVVTLLDPPPNLRPGLSATAKITTGVEHDAVTIPIQALTMRDKNDLEAQKKTAKPIDKTAPAAPASKKENTDLQGVFVIKNNKAEFHEVQTGLTGTTEIQVKSGVQPGDVIITGSYKVLKTLRNGAGVKVDNSLAKQPES
jgi:HlyD family secretion protein